MNLQEGETSPLASKSARKVLNKKQTGRRHKTGITRHKRLPSDKEKIKKKKITREEPQKKKKREGSQGRDAHLGKKSTNLDVGNPCRLL